MKGIIAAGHKETARAGIEMLEAGGNAFDATLAAMLMSFVAEASLTSMGGGGFMLTHTAEGKQTLYDFFVHTPKHKRAVEEVELVEAVINFGTTTQGQYIGRGTTAVPGCPAGMFAIHEALGSMPIKEIARPAIELARKGCLITPYQEYTYSILKPILLHTPESAAIYGTGDRLLRQGESTFNPALADTLEQLCEEGGKAFYQGDIAEQIVRDSDQNGGSLRREDMNDYQVIARNPLAYNYRDHTFLTNPPPSAGGYLISYGLGILSSFDLAKMGPHDPRYAHLLSAAMAAMETAKNEYIEHRKPGYGQLTSLLEEASLSQARKPLDYLGNTTHISVLDGKGNAASVTTTLGGAAGFILPGTGMQANNMLGEKDLNPGGLYHWTENERVPSMMSPSMLLQKGIPRLVLGSGGSSRIRTALLQTIINVLDHKMTVEEAVDFERMHWEDGLLNMEPGLIIEDRMPEIPHTQNKVWEDRNMFFGGVHAVAMLANGSLSGRADQRRDGTVLSC